MIGIIGILMGNAGVAAISASNMILKMVFASCAIINVRI